MGLRFTKMHGAGNDFAVLDWRGGVQALSASAIERMADRRFGIGFDQLLSIEPATREDCAFRYGIFNADGSIAGQCGNGARCVVAWLARAGALAPGPVRLEAPGAVVEARLLDDGQVRIDMGAPQFAPAAIPFVAEHEETRYLIEVGDRAVALGAVSMGNPHAVLEVDDVDTAPVAQLGAQIERHPRFPERCNVGFAQVVSPREIRLRVFERGVGETLACGSGACAAVALLRRRGRLDASVRVEVPGGVLTVDWAGEGQPAWLQGNAEFVYEGEWLL
jgi:diaminopimelate epimerase